MIDDAPKGSRLEVGIVRVYTSVLKKVPLNQVRSAIDSHAAFDWGDLDADEWIANTRAANCGQQVSSIQKLPSGEALYIATEANRKSTSVSLVGEKEDGRLVRIDWADHYRI